MSRQQLKGNQNLHQGLINLEDKHAGSFQAVVNARPQHHEPGLEVRQHFPEEYYTKSRYSLVSSA